MINGKSVGIIVLYQSKRPSLLPFMKISGKNNIRKKILITIIFLQIEYIEKGLPRFYYNYDKRGKDIHKI